MRPLLACVLLLLMTACGNDEQAASGGPALEGTPWVLASGVDVPGWEAHAPSAQFADGRLSGSSGCNRYSADYTLDGDALTLGPAVATKMACPGTAGAVETAFTGTLGRATGWRMDGEQLVLVDGEDEELLRFATASPVGAWSVTSFLQRDAVSSPLEGTEITATFAADGTLSGNAGCNRYSAKWRGDLEITGVFHTDMRCGTPKGVMEQEQLYLAALAKAAGFSVEGPTLTLLTATGTIAATYTRAP